MTTAIVIFLIGTLLLAVGISFGSPTTAPTTRPWRGFLAPIGAWLMVLGEVIYILKPLLH
jgi:hypothetical protein